MGKMPKGLPPVRLHPDDIHTTPEEWSFAAQDSEGNSVKEWLRIPPVLERELDILIQSKRFPYKTRSDLIRHALLRHVALMHKIEDDLPRHFLVFLRSMMELVGDEVTKVRTDESLRKLEERVQHHFELGDHGEGMRVLVTVREQLKDVPDSAAKRRFEARFKRQWGHILANGGPPKPGDKE